MGAFDIVAKAAKGAKKAAPFYSKIDEVLDSMPRNKGTGAEFLRELEKTKGVKPAEIQDRGIVKALKDAPKMTKAEVQKILGDNPPPRVKEEVRGGNELLKALDEKAQEIIGDSYATFDDLYGRDREKARYMVEADFGYDPETQYEKFRTPGGDNYREILLKLPKRGLNEIEQRNLMLYEADMRRGKELDPWHQQQYAALKAKEAAGSQDYSAPHFEGTPNILAHIRVQDFKTPEGKKVLLVDEIQSDWHQEGRDLRNKEIKRIMERDGVDKKTATAQVPDDFGYTQPEGVPDAPFKKNWHELAMKRVLDYAAEGGYDSVAITPGVQQVRRYEDATRQAVDEVAMYGDTLVGFKGGRKVIEQPISSPDELEQYIGKEMAQKLASAPPDMNFIRSIKGEDLTVGGEGMKGFYDEKLVNYLNNYGKQYGAQAGQLQLQTGKEMSRGPNGTDMIPSYSPTMQSFHSFDITPQMREQIQTKGQPLYSKIGVPGVEAAAGAGAATIGSQVFDDDNEQQVQNPVHFTENPDAMLLELMQRN